MKKKKKKKHRNCCENFLAVQWLALHASTAGGTVWLSHQGTKILHAVWHGKKNKTQNPETI